MYNVKSLDEFLSSHPKKYLIFDFDYTLFKLHLPWEKYLAGLAKIAKGHDLDLYSQLVKSGLGTAEIVNHFTIKYGRKVRQKLSDFSLDFEIKNLAGVSENKKLVAWVKTNASKYHFFVWTSNNTATIQPVFEEHGLEQIFQMIVGQEKVQLVKPDPEGFTKLIWPAIQSIQPKAKKSQCLMVGDSDADKDASAAAGIDFQLIEHFVKLTWAHYKKLLEKSA